MPLCAKSLVPGVPGVHVPVHCRELDEMAFKGPLQLKQFCDSMLSLQEDPFFLGQNVGQKWGAGKGVGCCALVWSSGHHPCNTTQHNTAELSLPSSGTDYTTIEHFAFPPSYCNTQRPVCTQSKQNPSSGPATSFLPTPPPLQRAALSFLGLPVQCWPPWWKNPTTGGAQEQDG